MLDSKDLDFNYRDYREEPLDRDELVKILDLLGVEPREVLRTKDRANKELGLTGDEESDRLLDLMAEHPTLLQRPIGVLGDLAALGRPPENLLQLFE